MYYEKLYVSRLGNLEEMNKFLEIYNLQRMNHEVMENLVRSIMIKDIESILKTTQQRNA